MNNVSILTKYRITGYSKIETDSTVYPDILELNKIYIFQFSNDSMAASIELQRLNNKQVNFIIITGLKTEKPINISGIAALSDNFYLDSEIDEDENGNAYPADEYIYNKDDCFIAIRVNSINAEILQLNISGCKKKNFKS